ncbi:MAG: DUF6300 family protein [Pseudonocardiales bacterium]
MTPIEVNRAQLSCHRCLQPPLLAVRVPHSFARPDHVEVRGWRTVPLCPRCDRDDPAAQGVLAFFTVYETITEDNVRDAGAVLHQWIEHIAAHPPTCTDADLNEEIRQWEAGEL